LFSLVAGFFSVLLAKSAGGIVGFKFANILLSAFGLFGAFLAVFALFLASLHFLFRIPWGKIAGALLKKIVAEYQDWQKDRRALALQTQAAMKEPFAIEIVAEKLPLRIDAMPNGVAISKEKKDKSVARLKEVRLEGSACPYILPPLDILTVPQSSKDRGKPLPGEIQAASTLLETTLKNFGVDARVTGVSPGPVITRYELSPAPGVKVSSIAALENDIALALKAKGIRILAPIPGKGAVGVEIPNARPAMVCLREILESPIFSNSQRPLLFGLGLSSDGEPKVADLQSMPHLLVAGATNSGKSVLIHSIIVSILFSSRPDEVKFVLIDPKRLELTFYEGIPHLFDPTIPAEKVRVITNPKDAAKALKAVVRLMEKRYEKFQLFGVRNIDAYNEQAAKAGRPREFFVVVIIDELADLMLVAKESVEDSIQRLTQMARAVGIHVVLATQRPSVDVITGLIKANLPCRIALQVISRVDSKVILDTGGADALQGKGDLLYLSVGAQKPERCQGAYVSESEITKLVSYLKTQAKPDYPIFDTMTRSAEADLGSLGVEPLEFSQALKLVLERRRVSQDLLKSHFGSSARATNLLSALEVKEFIHKPEGSNHWEIHFEQIEDYLRRHFPQVPLESGEKF
jgi:S-DNA-T family DNA segregation ATPase FtsK/SpoIIIE